MAATSRSNWATTVARRDRRASGADGSVGVGRIRGAGRGVGSARHLVLPSCLEPRFEGHRRAGSVRGDCAPPQPGLRPASVAPTDAPLMGNRVLRRLAPTPGGSGPRRPPDHTGTDRSPRAGTLVGMAAQYIYTMRDLRRFYPPDREVLKGINLSFYPGAKIGVIGSQRLGQVLAAADHGRRGRRIHRRGPPDLRLHRRLPGPGAPARPDQGRARQRRGRRGRDQGPGRPVQRGVRGHGRARRRLRQAAGRAGRAAGQDRRRRGLGPRAHLRDRHGRPAPAPGRCRRHHPLRRRAASGGPVPAPALQARPPAARRAHQPPRRRVGGLARAHPAGLPGHRGGRHPRPLLPRQRGRLDPRARPGRRHPLGGQLLVVAGAEAGPPGRRAEGRPVAPAGAAARARVDPDVAPGPPEQGQGPHQRLQRAGGRGRGRRAPGRQARDHHSRRATAGRPGRRRRGPGQGLRRPAAHRRPVLPPAPGGHRRASSVRTAPARPPCSG